MCRAHHLLLSDPLIELSSVVNLESDEGRQGVEASDIQADQYGGLEPKLRRRFREFLTDGRGVLFYH